MALARVVSFEGVDKDRIKELDSEIREGDPPEGMNPTEIIVLHDAGFSDAEAMTWMLEETDLLGTAPIDALRAGRKADSGVR